MSTVAKPVRKFLDRSAFWRFGHFSRSFWMIGLDMIRLAKPNHRKLVMTNAV